jgi:solute carrier family 36 (proton-coupled amino acid transporter)
MSCVTCRGFVFKVLRVCVVALLGAIAISVPGFDHFVTFVGSFCCSSLAFIIPAACHLVLFHDKLTPPARILDYFLVVFGFAGMIFGVWKSIQSMAAVESSACQVAD